MLEKLDGLDKKDKLTLICGFIVLIAILIVLSSGDTNNEFVINKAEEVDIKQLMNNIGDNYTLTIVESINQEENEYIFYTDSKLNLYEKISDDYGYLEYNNKIYINNTSTMELNKINDEISFINSPYYDIYFIKELVNSCNFEYLINNKVNCKLTLNEFVNYYNSKYGTNYSGNSYDFIEINILYQSKIKSIYIDYSVFDKFVKSEDNNHKVMLKFDYTKNDFSIIYDNYKDILES